MLKQKYLYLLLTAIMSVSLFACSDDDSDIEPSFAQIVISPEQDVYHVGDVVKCSITRTSPGSDTLKEDSYWWYASWWFSDSEMKADFAEFNDSNVNTSDEITLTTAGKVKLYFFGQLKYPNWDWRKVEIARTITVVE
jgi:hypothetical protein